MTSVEALNFSQDHLGMLQARATARHFDAHLHDTFSVVVIKKGCAHVRSARWSGVVNAGDVFFFNPYEVHGAMSAAGNVDYETFYPSMDCLRSAIRANDVGSIHIQTDVLTGARETRDLIDLLSNQLPAAAAVRAKLEDILLICTYSVEESFSPSVEIVRRACQLIRADCTRAVRTNDLAREIGVHESHFIRAFTTTIGLPPQTYIRQVRVAEAHGLIQAGHRLSDVAQILGFCDQAHFTREFKKVFGVAPGEMSRGIAHKAPTH
jgi:AraC-like DNA-binding protein